MTDRQVLRQKGNLLTFSVLDYPVLIHGTFNRHGGISPPPWNTNNVSYGLGDSDQNIKGNREQIKKTLAIKHLVSAQQVHGSRVFILDKNTKDDLVVDGYDGLITNVPGLGLMVQQADCQAVFFFDPEKRAVGIAHVGWRGSVKDIIAETVYAMSQSYSTEPADIKAAISPSLGPCCAEFVNYRSELPAALHGYQVRADYFDFWAISSDQLCGAGVRPENIQAAKICSCCSRDYFSYRREHNTGRFASLIGLRER